MALPLNPADGKRLGNLSLYAASECFNESTINQYTELANNLAYGATALRARAERGEHAARLARANELLRRSLDALARDQSLQSFVGQVLVVLTEQLGGHSSTLWLIEINSGKRICIRCLKMVVLITAEESDHPNARKPRQWTSDDPSWVTLQRKRPFFLSDPDR